jgi:hypothetical protein
MGRLFHGDIASRTAPRAWRRIGGLWRCGWTCRVLRQARAHQPLTAAADGPSPARVTERPLPETGGIERVGRCGRSRASPDEAAATAPIQQSLTGESPFVR